MKRKWIRALTPLALACCMVLALAFPGGAAEELVKLDEKCSLTVVPGNFTGDGSAYLTQQLEGAAVVIDLYKVAVAIPNRANGLTYDGYQFELEDQYGGEDGLVLSGEMTSADWREQSQKAARIALGITVDPVSGAVSGNVSTEPVRTGEAVKQEIGELDAGLYLLIARRGGTGDPDVAYTDVDQYTVVKDSNGTEKIATIANSHDCVFSFEPELISLPGKDPYMDENGNLVSNTANPGPWRYHMEPVLKAQAEIRYGSLQITKELPDFEVIAGDVTPRPVTFIFEIEAFWEDRIGGKGEQKEYRDVVAVNFTAAGSKDVYRLGEELKIPVGAAVTVREVYSGSGYQPYLGDVTDEDARREAFVQETTIREAEQTFGVTFTNYYNRRNVDGHGIINNFTYSEEENRWIWTFTHADGTIGGENVNQGEPVTPGGNTPEPEGSDTP